LTGKRVSTDYESVAQLLDALETMTRARLIVSSEFAGKSKLQQHQLVYKALGGAMGGELHALQLQTCVPT